MDDQQFVTTLTGAVSAWGMADREGIDMEKSTKTVDDRLLRVAVLAADMWAMQPTVARMTRAEQTRGIVRTAVLHLIEQGLLIVPDDLSERLDQPIALQRTESEPTP